MVVTENVTVYQCSFCRKKQFRKCDMAKHEARCTSNPLNWSACEQCRHLSEIEVKYQAFIDVDEFTGTTERTTKGFFCSKLNQKMYPFKAKRKGYVDRFPETFKDQVQMPSVCDVREELSLEEIINRGWE